MGGKNLRPAEHCTCGETPENRGLGATPLPATDLELVRQARRGDAAAFHAIVDRYAGRLFGLAYSLLHDRADAEDAVQETLVGAHRGLGRFEERSSLWTWLARILVRQASKQRRARRSDRVIRISDAASGRSAGEHFTSDEPNFRVASSSAGVEVRIDLDAALETLSEDHRQVIVLREFEQLSYDEIAQVLSVPRGTVESRLHRARAELKQKLAAYRS